MGVSVRHNSRVAALLAFAAAVMTVAWFSRALQTGSLADWLWCVLVASVGLAQLLVVRDGRAPLMVADEHGVRVRRGETWSGLRWQDIEHVEVQSPGSWLRDGQIVVHPRLISVEDALRDEARNEEAPDEEAAPAEADLERYVVRLSRTTKVDFDGMTGDLVTDLDALASGRVPVLVWTKIEPQKVETEEKPAKAEKPERITPGRGRWAGMLARTEATTQRVEVDESGVDESGVDETGVDQAAETEEVVSQQGGPVAAGVPDTAAGPVSGPVSDPALDLVTDPLLDPASEPGSDEVEEEPEPEFDPVEPGREMLPAARSEVLRDSVRMLPNPPAIPTQRTAESPVLVARVDDFTTTTEPRPSHDAMIGPLIAAARNRARLSIDVLSERTRIRPHVLECIEVDDFEACGGDFYARGHLRTLARIFGLEPQELLDLYDTHYAKAEIEARQVFEAELATGIGGGVRAAHTGPRWSLLAACVLALAGVWGVARVFNDTPQELVSPAPNVVDAAGLAKGETAGSPRMTLAPLEVSAQGTNPQVVVRDRKGRILWAGKLTDGQHQQVIGLAPFDVTASNGGAVKVSFLGKPRGAVGDSTAAANKQFG